MTTKDAIIYKDSFNKNTYRIPADKKNLLEVYKNRYAVVLAVTVLLRAFIHNIYYLVGFGIVITLFTEYVYRKKFLKQYTILPSETSIPTKKIDNKAIISNVVLYMCFGLLLGYVTIFEMEDTFSKWMLLAVAIAAVGLAIRYALEYVTNNSK